jgi:predicted O-methyltransferase YrrM
MRQEARVRLPWRIPAFGPPIETSLTEQEAAELQRLAALRRVLEIGAAFGYSTVVMADVALQVWSVDPHVVHNSLDVINQNLGRHAVASRVRILVGESLTVLPSIGAQQFDLVFVDGDHTAAGVAFDLEQAQRLAVSGGILAFHDWGEETCPEVRQVLEAWRQPDRIVDTLAVYQLG